MKKVRVWKYVALYSVFCHRGVDDDKATLADSVHYLGKLAPVGKRNQLQAALVKTLPTAAGALTPQRRDGGPHLCFPCSHR